MLLHAGSGRYRRTLCRPHELPDTRLWAGSEDTGLSAAMGGGLGTDRSNPFPQCLTMKFQLVVGPDMGGDALVDGEVRKHVDASTAFNWQCILA